MPTNSVQEAWLASAPGRQINPDNAFGLQCVDVADDYALAIFPGKGWAETIGGVNGARDFTGRSNAFFTWHDNIPGDVNSIPQRGDVAIFGGSASNQWGHVVVVLSANAHTMTVIQQDGFLQVPAHIATLPYDGPGTGYCTGWMRPNVAPDAPLELTATQRVVGPVGVKERLEATTASAQDRLFVSGDVLNFKGFVRGEHVNGSDVWFVGAFAGTFFHCSGFTNTSAAGLPDLTPKTVTAPPKLAATQRFAGAAGVILRDAPNKNGRQVQTYNPGDVLNFKGFVRGERPYGSDSSDLWLVGISGSYVWRDAVEPANVDGLPDLTPKAAPTPTPGPVVVAPLPTVEKYTFPKRWDCVTRVRPAHIGNLQRGNFPERPSHLVVHQMDDPSRNPTLLGTGSWFEQERPAAPSSTHFGAEDDELHAFVDTVDRAFGSGTVGNNYVQIEVPPNPSDKTIETVKRFQREWLAKKGYALILTDHRSIPGNSTNCGSYIPLSRFSIETKAPAPTPAPVQPEKPADGPKHAGPDDDSAASFVDFLLGLFKASKK